MAFERIETAHGEHLRSTLLYRAGVRHAFGTRRGGSSTGRHASANRGFYSEDEEDRVRENWRRLLAGAGLDEAPLHYLRQVHGAEVVEVAGPGEGAFRWLGEADGLVSGLDGVALAVTTADCVPVLLGFDAEGEGSPSRVAALHCGWRSTAAGLLPRFLRRVGATPRAVALGPHIRGCHFEVGPEVAAVLEDAAGGTVPRPIRREVPGSNPLVDLEAVLLAQLEACGVPPERVDVGAPCTYCDPEIFFSYRRDGPGGGLLGHVIGTEGLQSGAADA